MAQTDDTLQRQDLLEALRIRPHVLRQWSEAFEPLKSRDTEERSANLYLFIDVLFLAVIRNLMKAGLTKKTVGELSALLYKALGQPRPRGAADEIVLHRGGDAGWHLGAAPSTAFMEIRLQLGQVRAQVVDWWTIRFDKAQGEFNYGLRAIGGGGAQRASPVSVRRAEARLAGNRASSGRGSR